MRRYSGSGNMMIRKISARKYCIMNRRNRGIWESVEDRQQESLILSALFWNRLQGIIHQWRQNIFCWLWNSRGSFCMRNSHIVLHWCRHLRIFRYSFISSDSFGVKENGYLMEKIIRLLYERIRESFRFCTAWLTVSEPYEDIWEKRKRNFCFPWQQRGSVLEYFLS